MSQSLNQHFTPVKLLKFSIPCIIMMLFMSLYTIIDGIFISRFVGSNALSSVNISAKEMYKRLVRVCLYSLQLA